MSKGAFLAAAVLLSAAQAARAGQPGIGSMPISTGVAELAAAAGIHRVDASTLPLDIVRIAFASPDGTSVEEAAARAAIARVLGRAGSAGDALPLPLSAKTWTDRIVGSQLAVGRIAPAIFGARPAALLYHALMGVEPATLEWIESNPSILDLLLKHPGVSAVYARSIRIRDGRVVTPGDGADDVWSAVVGADPAHPAKFVAALLSARAGRVAGFYDAVAHLDAPHQAFAIGKATDTGRVARAQRLVDALTRLEPRWRVAEHPFMRPDVDAAVLLRAVRVGADGQLLPPASREVWSRVFGGADERGAIDAAWLADRVLEGGDSAARERLDAFLFGQRALASAGGANDGDVVDALHGFRRYPALMLTLEGHGLDAAAYAAAARAAAAVNGDDDAVTIFQAGVAIVDLARRSGTLDAAQARTILASLVGAGSARESRARLLAWVRADLLPAFKGAVAGGDALGADALLLAALAGPRSTPGPPILWEEQRFHADLSTPELRRLTAIRGRQDELPLDAALAAATPRKLTALAMSMMAIVYASALGDPDGQPANAGPVWRRHRTGGGPGLARSPTWRLANEFFARDGWHLTGSLLRLDAALPALALRRVDSTEMPTPSVLSITDRRTLERSVALSDPRSLTDDDRDAVAAALARGRARAAALATNAADLDAAADAAGLSEWRRNALRWTLATTPARTIESWTLLELFRLGGGDPRAAWGGAAVPLDGCLCLRFPAAVPWEEFAGRAATGQLATQLADVMLRTAEALAARRLPARLGRHVAAFAMQDVIDRARPAYFDDWLPVAFAARDLRDDQFDDYIAALTVAGPLVPVTKGVR
jgi:hypothetical protein